MFESSCFHGEALTVALAVASLQRALHGTKKCRKFDNFQRPVSKMPSQTLEISFSFFFFPGPSIKQLLDWHGQAESRRSRSAGRTSNLKFCVMTGLLGYVSTLIVSGRAECFRSTSTSLLQSVVSYNTLL